MNLNESLRSPESIFIKLVSIKNLRGFKGDVVSSSIKVEFRDKVLGDSPKVECSLDQPALINFTTTLICPFNDLTFLEDISYRPVILTVTEILPKEKKQKEDKSMVLGQCSFDMLPLLQGTNKFEINLIINSVPGSTLEQLQTELPQPSIDVEVSCERALITEEELSSNNIMSITMESLYSPPEGLFTNNAGAIYVAALSLPSTDEKENVIIFPSGIVKAAGEKDSLTKKIKWVVPGSATNESIFIPNKIVSHDDYEKEDGDLKDTASRSHRISSEKEKHRILWNMDRRTILQESSLKLLRTRIAKYRQWPVEVFRIGGSGGNKSRKDEDNVINYHGYAFVNFSPLLFPGVKRIRGAYKVIAYNEVEHLEMTGRRNGIMDEAVRITNTILHQNVGSTAGKKSQEKKPDKKPISKPAGASSSLGQASMQPEQNVVEAAEVISNVEGQQYDESESYIMIEISLDQPLVEKRKPEEIAANVSAYIPTRDKFAKRTNSADKALEDYHNQVAIICKQLLVEFKKMYSEELTNSDILNNQEAMEQMRQELIYDLNSSGKYFAFKEQLKYAVIKIVREKCLKTSTITDPDELQEFLRSLFVYLVDELQVGLSKVITLKDTTPSPVVDISQEQLLHFAKEAEVNEDHVWADRYHKERIASDRNNTEFWFDYSVYLMAHKSLLDCEFAFKECVSLSPQNLNGLVMYGIICSLQERFEEAETFFEAATTYYPQSIFAWTCFILYYHSIGNEIQQEMAFQEACKLNVREKKLLKNKENVKIINTDNVAEPVDQGTNEPFEVSTNNIENETVRSVDVIAEGNATKLVSDTLGTEMEISSNPAVDNNMNKIDGKESVMSSQKSTSNKRGTIGNIPLAKASSLTKGDFNSSQTSKSRSSPKESTNEDNLENKNVESNRSIFLKAAQILLDFKCFAYVEKALAQELIFQNKNKDFLPLEHQKILYAEYQLILGKTRLGQGAYEEAEAALLETVQITYDNADAWASLGHLKFIVGDENAAQNCYTRALSLLNDLTESHPVYMRLASLYLIQEKYIESKQAFLLACKHSPTCLSWLGVGICCFRLGELDEAEEALAEANILNNENAEVWGYLSLICLKSERKLEAEQSYKYAVKLGLSEQSNTLLEEINDLQNELGFGNPGI